MHSKEQYNKHNYFWLKVVLIIIVLANLLYIVFQENDWNQLWTSITAGNPFYLLLLITLMPVNWILEALKWKKLLNQTHKINLKTALASVLGGVAIGSVTPNRVGSFVGRLFWLPSDKRIDGTIHTFYSNWAQLFTTILMGGIGVFYFWKFNILPTYITTGSIIIYFIILLASLLLYLNPASIWKWIRQFFGVKIQTKFDQIFNWEQKQKGIVLALSLMRYLVFGFQFYLALQLFKIDIPFFQAVGAITMTYLLTTFIPSLLFGKLVIRESVAVFCFGFFISNLPIIVITSLLVWFVNILIPAVTGSILLTRIKKRNSN